jgi:hypothetical protein
MGAAWIPAGRRLLVEEGGMFGIGVTEVIILGFVCLVPVVVGVAAVIIVLATKNKGPGND